MQISNVHDLFNVLPALLCLADGLFGELAARQRHPSLIELYRVFDDEGGFMKDWKRDHDRGYAGYDWLRLAAYACIVLSGILHGYYVFGRDNGESAVTALMILAAAFVFSEIYPSLMKSVDRNSALQGHLSNRLADTRKSIDALDKNLSRLDESSRD